MQKRFIFISEAKKFQRKMQRAGFKTRRETRSGITSPYTIIHYIKRKK